jgi:hypothetical protein
MTFVLVLSHLVDMYAKSAGIEAAQRFSRTQTCGSCLNCHALEHVKCGQKQKASALSQVVSLNCISNE